MHPGDTTVNTKKLLAAALKILKDHGLFVLKNTKYKKSPHLIVWPLRVQADCLRRW